MTSKYVAESLGWFLRKVAIDYVRYGYVRYALCTIPEVKAGEEELRRIDRKLISTYRVTYHGTTRARRRAKGLANVAYVRYRRWFVLLSSEGMHDSDEFERLSPKDIREVPFVFCGYIVSLKRGKVQVAMTGRRMGRIEKIAKQIALHQEGKVRAFFLNISHSIHFPGVVRQKLKLLRSINQKRKRAGLSRLSWTIPRPNII